jgi:hypothetical protein
VEARGSSTLLVGKDHGDKEQHAFDPHSTHAGQVAGTQGSEDPLDDTGSVEGGHCQAGVVGGLEEGSRSAFREMARNEGPVHNLCSGLRWEGAAGRSHWTSGRVSTEE